MIEINATGIIILNYNNSEDTINCIDSIEEYNTANIKIIIVDNGSRNEIVDNIHNKLSVKYKGNYERLEEDSTPCYPLKKVTFLISKKNDGYANGNNKGLKLADHDDEIENVMILNNDVLFVEDIVPSLVDFMEQKKDCAIVSPILYKKDLDGLDYNCARRQKSVWDVILSNFDFVCIKTSKYRILEKEPEKVQNEVLPIEIPSGSCMLLEKSLFKDYGWFDPHTFLYFEEDILCTKVKKSGRKNYMLPRLKCIHLGASTTKTKGGYFMMKKSFESQQYFLRNYCDMSFMQRGVLHIAALYMKMKLYYLKSK